MKVKLNGNTGVDFQQVAIGQTFTYTGDLYVVIPLVDWRGVECNAICLSGDDLGQPRRFTANIRVHIVDGTFVED